MKYFKQTAPFVVPTTDGKVIREHFGLASSKDTDFSLAHMIAPPHWSESHQTPTFDEVTFVFKGRKRILIDEQEEVILHAGESILIKGGTRIQYSNPFDEACHYVALCMPAFSIDEVNRED